MAPDYFYHGVCQWCMKGYQQQIKKCSNCRLVSYCSTEHQKNDWPIHKQLCKKVRFLEKSGYSLFDYHGKTTKDWTHHRTEFMCNVELLLKRKLYPFERQMILFPNVCELCHQYNLNVYFCNSCKCTYYCSQKHLEINRVNHTVNCEELKLCFDIDMFLAHSHLHMLEFLDNVIKKFRYKKIIFPNSMEEYLSKYIGTENKIKKILFSEPMSYVLTLIFGLLKCPHINVFTLSEIVIHVIGSNENEEYMIKFMDTLFYWLPQLQQISLLMIGPDCDRSQMTILPSNDLKHNFEGAKTFTVQKITGLYHNLVRKEQSDAPHLIVTFNCGFSEFVGSLQDTWGDTIKAILQFKKTMFIMTSYTAEEAIRDYLRITKLTDVELATQVIIRSQRNTFRSLRPLRDWENTSKVFYLNNYISMFYIK